MPTTVTRRLTRSAGSFGAEVAVALQMHGIEGALDRVAVLGGEQGLRQFDGDGVLLADITHIGRARLDDRLRSDGGLVNRLQTLGFHLRVERLDFGENRQRRGDENRSARNRGANR